MGDQLGQPRCRTLFSCRIVFCHRPLGINPRQNRCKRERFYKMGPFLATFILFFIAEMGDKTQIATIVLAAKYDSLTMVVAGTTLGMLLANVPVVIVGHFSADKLPMLWIHRGCAMLFALLGVATLFL